MLLCLFTSANPKSMTNAAPSYTCIVELKLVIGHCCNIQWCWTYVCQKCSWTSVHGWNCKSREVSPIMNNIQRINILGIFFKHCPVPTWAGAFLQSLLCLRPGASRCPRWASFNFSEQPMVVCYMSFQTCLLGNGLGNVLQEVHAKRRSRTTWQATAIIEQTFRNSICRVFCLRLVRCQFGLVRFLPS